MKAVQNPATAPHLIPSKPVCLILSGLPGSGKTTAALAWIAEDQDHRQRINYDDLRLEMFGDGWIFNLPDEKKMKAEAELRAATNLNAGFSVVIDNTNLTERVRNRWRDLALGCGAGVEYQDFDTPIHVCIERDSKRSGSARVGRAVIERLALTRGYLDWQECRCNYEMPRLLGGFGRVKSDLDGQYHRPHCYLARKFVIVDIDGTVADCSHRLHWINGDRKTGFHPRWDKFHAEVDRDTPIPEIINLVKILSYHYNIVFVSGRSPDYGCGIKTEDWLNKFVGSEFYLHLFMRGEQDTRPDAELKQEILDLLMPKDRIAFVLDDRPQVIKMWRSNGLKVLDCGNGIEF